MTLDSRTLAEYRSHLQDEADAAFLYRVLAEAEGDKQRREIYRRLAAVEDRHVGLWQEVLTKEGVAPPRVRPTLRARALTLLARRFGPGLLSSLLLREEAREVRGYLSLHRRANGDSIHDTALTLARESAEHAETLRRLVGASGEPWHRAESGGVLRNLVYGFNDGLTANFGLVAGVIGADVAPHVILVSGVAGMLADALSMGSSGYLAAKSEQEVYAHELAMEAAEIRLMPEVEAEELALVYEAKGVAPAEARRIAAEVIADPERALAEKAREELGIGERSSTPLQEAWVTGTATAVGAFIPVAPFLFLSGTTAIWTSFAIAMLCHFAVGAARSVLTGRSAFRSGLDMFLIGLGVAAVAYLVGDAVARLF